MQSEFLTVAGQILQREQRSMSAKEITSLAIRDSLFSDKLAGKTPHQTMKSKLSVHIRRYGTASVFVRTEPGKFQLRQTLLSQNHVKTCWYFPATGWTPTLAFRGSVVLGSGFTHRY